MASLSEIHAMLRERVEELRPLKEEYEQLERALAALNGAVIAVAPTARKRTPRVVDPEAPYGRKADGTPRKRPGRRATKAAPKAEAPAEATIHVVTAGVPPVKDGAEPAYVTQEG